MCCLYTRQLSGDIAFLFFCSGSGQRLLQLCGQTLFHFVCGSFREGHGKNGVNGDMILHDQIHQTCNQHGGLPASCRCGYQDVVFLCLNRLQLCFFCIYALKSADFIIAAKHTGLFHRQTANVPVYDSVTDHLIHFCKITFDTAEIIQLARLYDPLLILTHTNNVCAVVIQCLYITVHDPAVHAVCLVTDFFIFLFTGWKMCYRFSPGQLACRIRDIFIF